MSIKEMLKEEMSKYTPGPWKIEEPTNLSLCHGKTIWTKGIGEMLISQVAGLAQFDEANARLIAAAPDLLEACKDMLIALDPRVLNATYGQSKIDSMERMQKAIAKAEGTPNGN